MRRLLVIPAAGLGTRLKAATPKALVAVNGRPMLDHLLDLYRGFVQRIVVIAHPSFKQDVERWSADKGFVDVRVQRTPTGMLDAILLARPIVNRERPDAVWITWCDQVGVLPETLDRLAEVTSVEPSPPLAMPTVKSRDPYIHLVRDTEGRISEVLHRREGDAMPSEGESDMGLFALSRRAYQRQLPLYADEVTLGPMTGERNFLPFIAWLARRAPVVTFPCTDPMEAVGVNTPDDLRTVEAWLAMRATRSS
jgi:bifunctional N-acetylglucosamine-1-phosphate-uridyltransferase/glucosamine-1-phosphate-acetyltransferase GlmU-like protein